MIKTCCLLSKKKKKTTRFVADPKVTEIFCCFFFFFTIRDNYNLRKIYKNNHNKFIRCYSSCIDNKNRFVANIDICATILCYS